ncbi:hypothetical protein EYF80_044831 [Liparis tanakae]|uniref:Uncharacterized protein n=1 Tax=Liparis tanakae TaxID=230148 RepID=A0A4Z2FUN5_9TELE|nr:hypothetical protein EYF80_044831 [Liparis tanakae]
MHGAQRMTPDDPDVFGELPSASQRPTRLVVPGWIVEASNHISPAAASSSASRFTDDQTQYWFLCSVGVTVRIIWEDDAREPLLQELMSMFESMVSYPGARVCMGDRSRAGLPGPLGVNGVTVTVGTVALLWG